MPVQFCIIIIILFAQGKSSWNFSKMQFLSKTVYYSTWFFHQFGKRYMVSCYIWCLKLHVLYNTIITYKDLRAKITFSLWIFASSTLLSFNFEICHFRPSTLTSTISLVFWFIFLIRYMMHHVPLNHVGQSDIININEKGTWCIMWFIWSEKVSQY